MSNYLIAVDPGRFSGFAVFKDRVLVQTWEEKEVAALYFTWDLVKINAVLDNLQNDALNLYIEIPHVYPVQKWKGDPNDLIGVALIVGAMSGAMAELAEELDFSCSIKHVKPYEWKGATPKKISNERTMKKLCEAEQALITPHSTHVIDAIGLGLWTLNR
jgi:hypothetical protein